MSVSPDDLTFLQKLSMLPGRIDQKLQPFGGAANLGAALLANSGYSTTPRTFGSVLGTSALQAQQMALASRQVQQEQEDASLMRRYREAQIQALQAKPTTDNPNSVKEYEYARQNGFRGSFQDWITAGGQSSRPSSVQEWEFYSSLPPEMQQRYLEMKRNPNVFFGKVNEVPTIARAGSAGMPVQTTPLSTTASEAAAAGTVKQAEASGGALGKAQGEIAGSIQTKGANAVGTKQTLDIAEPLIDAATGSLAGAARDKLAAVFGAAPEGAQAIAQLKVLQAGLMTSMPRMEGPQSDRDVMLYREAAGQIGDPTVPADIKKKAVQTIRQIQDKYIERAGGAAPKYREGQTAKNPKTGETLVFRNGAWVKP